MKAGYKQTEVGVIPEDWEVKALGEISHPVRGGSPRPAGDPKYFNGNYIPWLTVAALTNLSEAQLYVSQTEGYLTEEGSKWSRIIEKDTLIIANSGATLGVAKLLEIKCCANDGIAALYNLSQEVSKLYLVYYINSKTKYLRDVVATGNGQPNLNTSLISDFKVPLPPTIAEQTAIATALSDTDELIQSLEKLITKKRLIKHGALQELLKPKENWVEKSLDELFAFSGGLTASREQLSDKGLAYLHYGDIHGSKKSYIDIEREYADIPKLDVPLNKVPSATLLGDGDLVFVDASEDDEGTSRHVVIKNPNAMPYIAGLHTIVAKSTNDLVDKNYRQYCFQSNDVKRQFKFYAVGTKVSGVSKSNIGKILLTLPPTNDEQRRIAASLSDMDAELAALEAKLDKYRHIKQGMMQELLTGRIRLV